MLRDSHFRLATECFLVLSDFLRKWQSSYGEAGDGQVVEPSDQYLELEIIKQAKGACDAGDQIAVVNAQIDSRSQGGHRQLQK